MSSHDVRDMLDLPGEAGPRPAKKQKLSAPRPVLKGLAREVQNLSGDNPIAIVPEVTVFKKKKFGSRKPAAKWELRGFKNSARNGDPLVLHHWRRKADIVPGSGGEEGTAEQSAKPEPALEDSTFAKFNVHVNTPQYTDEQYNLVLQSNDWTKDETDYLLQLVRDLDLRWPCIWDRYEYQTPIPQGDGESTEGAMVAPPKVRTMEDMKARYYAVAAAMMKVNTKVEVMNHAEFNLLELMQGYDPIQEANRKKFAEAAFRRTRDEAKEEESLLVELKRILARSERQSDERRELYQLLEAPASSGPISIYQSSQGLTQLFQQLMTVDKTKKRKPLMGVEGVSPAPGPSGPSQQASFDRRDSNIRESIPGPSGGNAPNTNNKKGPAQAQSDRRQLTPEEEAMYGVKRFERITTSGPSFRHEKIKKPIISKSQTQQQKINNVLVELGVPNNIFMPTFAVGEAFDNLLAGVNLLLDQKKHMDKLQGELNTALNIKAEREKRERAERGEPEPEPEAEAEAEPSTEVDKATTEKPEEPSTEQSVKVEEEREKSAAPSIRGVSGAHKRSASVLSAVSDKDTKRQKK
ncbi:SWR1-complex protein 4 [Leptodontidium sp. 2 PMI_412]|nr:putative SWR1-complex protein 4 [Leptodontidium sp. MPI-SDFR-AT-0119]KAH9223738.1 SWR1-complex protein 4 [Leptodontidium sp. 2 PMI_412]